MATGVFDVLDAGARSRLVRRGFPRWRAPMLATLTDTPFSSPDWIYERKLDGVRCLVYRDRRVRLFSRNRNSLDARFPELVETIAGAGSSFVADGELVAFEGRVTSFARLQRPGRVAVKLYLFDLLHVDGHDTTALAVRDRKKLLRHALAFHEPLRYTPHRNRDGERFLADACRRGWEGLIAKLAGGPYVGGRSRDWLKLKCTASQELVIVGRTDPRGAREGFGALLLGYREAGRLRYAGKVGTGFDARTLSTLRKRLGRLERRDPPVDDPPRMRGVHWVGPEVVAQIGFTEWTRDGRLRHPRFEDLRADKSAREVVRERGG